MCMLAVTVTLILILILAHMHMHMHMPTLMLVPTLPGMIPSTAVPNSQPKSSFLPRL